MAQKRVIGVSGIGYGGETCIGVSGIGHGKEMEDQSGTADGGNGEM